jgi:hypothetical protein
MYHPTYGWMQDDHMYERVTGWTRVTQFGFNTDWMFGKAGTGLTGLKSWQVNTFRGFNDPIGGNGSIERSGNNFTINWNQTGEYGASWSSTSGSSNFSSGEQALFAGMSIVERTNSWSHTQWGSASATLAYYGAAQSMLNPDYGSMCACLDQDDPNDYQEINGTFRKNAYDFIMADGVGVSATFYVKGGYNVSRVGNLFYLTGAVSMKTLSQASGTIEFESKAHLIVDGKLSKSMKVSIREAPPVLRQNNGRGVVVRDDYSNVGSFSFQLPKSGRAEVWIDAGYFIQMGSQGNQHSRNLSFRIYVFRPLGQPRN